MIPPVTPGQTDDKQNMVSWKNTFSMRQVSLMNLAAGQLGIKNGNRGIPNCCRSYSVTSPAKSLDLLRKNLQSAINKDIDNVIKKYLEKFFQPAINNIKSNLGKESVTEEHVKEACKQMLEDAKLMYKTTATCDCRDNETNTLLFHLNPQHRKRKDLEADTEITLKRYRTLAESTKYKPTVKCEGPKWNSNRLSEESLFIMGPRANKVLGYGQTRGRLYARHPDLVRYSGDQEDKEWLASKNLMPPSGGKAYVMILQDIKELTENDDYRNNPNLQLHEMKGFTVPKFLLCKIKNFMEHCTNPKKPESDLDSLESGRSTPSDCVQIIESSTKGFINIPEVGPGSKSEDNSGMLSSGLLMSISNDTQAVTVLKEG